LAAITTIILVGADRDQPAFDKITILPVVAISGTLGAFVSALRRLYSFQDIFPVSRYSGLLKNSNLYVVAYSSIPPLVGFIAATVLYIVFASEILKGAMFPTFTCEIDKCEHFLDFLRHWRPAQPTDYAKAIVWGFIAGFSERFVPDILNRLSEKSGNADKNP
jgi:hypothetical protein